MSTMSSDRCISETIEVGESMLFLAETEGDQIVLILDGIARPIPEATKLLAGLDTAAVILAAIA